MKFNECLKIYRQRAGITQFKLADMLCVSPATISKYEVGTVTPDIDRLIMLSKIFNVSTDELLGLSENSNKTIKPIEYKPDEIELFELFKQLPEKYKYEVKGYIKGLISSK